MVAATAIDWITEPLPGEMTGSAAFARLQGLPHCLWLDSASDHRYPRGRYSFVTADPVAWCGAYVTSPNPWGMLRQWCLQLERVQWPKRDDLPPFRGGVAGLLAYDAARWLEPSAFATSPWDCVTPSMAMGVYDWVIAIDHQTGTRTLISTGLDETLVVDRDRAKRRCEQILGLLTADASVEPKRDPEVPRQSDLHWSPELNWPAELQDWRSWVKPTSQRNLWSNFSNEELTHQIAEIIERIRAGDSFQVNLAQSLQAESTCSASELYLRLRDKNPAPYGGFLDAGDYQVLSSSPEGFLQVRGREVITRPIKGTVPRTGNKVADGQYADQLLASEKDRAENIMIVDLMRNDLSRVCEDESVQVTGLCELEKYQRVQHLVSTVVGRLRPEVTVAELLSACFPGGSITGAPKVEAMRTITQLEQRPRGAYCGSLGYMSCCGNADFNILIRTLTQQNGVLTFPVGGGITARSEPQHEAAETWTKASSLLDAVFANNPNKHDPENSQ